MTLTLLVSRGQLLFYGLQIYITDYRAVVLNTSRLMNMMEGNTFFEKMHSLTNILQSSQASYSPRTID